MKGCIIGPRDLTFCENAILREGRKVFGKNFFYAPLPSIAIHNSKVFYKRFDLTKLDFVIPRIPRTYAWYGYLILSILKEKVYLPIVPESVIIARNKFLTLLALKEAGLPVPETYLSVSRQTIESLLDEMSFPVVMKLLHGSLGKGVMFADSKSSALSLMDTMERFREPIFLEEYVPNPGEDIRAFVLGEEVLGAMKRIAKKDERRANIAIGGKGKAIKLKPSYEDLAIKAAKVLGMDICGIDMIRGPKGPVIIEANVNVHFEGLTKATGINVAREIVKFVKSEVGVTKKLMLDRFWEWLRQAI